MPTDLSALVLPIIRLRGSHRAIGRQLGEAKRAEVKEAVELVQSEVAQVSNLSVTLAQAERYVPAIEKIAPRFLEEIGGLAEGADITFAQALLLQLRFEAVGYDADCQAPAEAGEGCSSFAFVHQGVRLSGQNVDIRPEHLSMGQIVQIEPPDGPSLLFYTYYAGLLGYLGVNSEGLSVFGNALLAPGWRVGFPRYLVLRLALEQSSVEAVESMLRSLIRASTINLVVSDRHGAIADFELTVDRYARLSAEGGAIFHTNHYIAEEFQSQERLVQILPDSPGRLAAGRRRLKTRADDVSPFAFAKALLCDHTDHPASICRHGASRPETTMERWMTVASLIARPDDGVLYACAGNPCMRRAYTRYAFV